MDILGKPGPPGRTVGGLRPAPDDRRGYGRTTSKTRPDHPATPRALRPAVGYPRCRLSGLHAGKPRCRASACMTPRPGPASPSAVSDRTTRSLLPSGLDYHLVVDIFLDVLRRDNTLRRARAGLVSRRMRRPARTPGAEGAPPRAPMVRTPAAGWSRTSCCQQLARSCRGETIERNCDSRRLCQVHSSPSVPIRDTDLETGCSAATTRSAEIASVPGGHRPRGMSCIGTIRRFVDRVGPPSILAYDEQLGSLRPRCPSALSMYAPVAELQACGSAGHPAEQGKQCGAAAGRPLCRLAAGAHSPTQSASPPAARTGCVCSGDINRAPPDPVGVLDLDV